MIPLQEILRVNFYTVRAYCSYKCSFPRSIKIFAEKMLAQCWKVVMRHFAKLRLCNVVKTLVLRCHNVTKTSFLSVATTLLQCHFLLPYNFANWHRRNFHFKLTVKVDKTNRPTLRQRCWVYLDYRKMLFWKIS